MVETKKKDYTTAVVVAGGVGALALGAWLMFRPKGAKAGDNITATFEFDYYGDGGMYILQVSLGRIWPFSIFDHVEGMTWARNMELSVLDAEGNELERPIRFKEELEFELPLGIKPKKYDAEAGIRVPGSEEFDFVENGKILISGALLVEEKK